MTSKEPGEWKLWQTVIIRKFIKRYMKPVTASQIFRRKTILSAGYLISTLILFHRMVLRVKQYDEDSDIRQAVDMNIDSAKIIRFEKGRLKEVIDYKREDYPQYIEDRPAFAQE